MVVSSGENQTNDLMKELSDDPEVKEFLARKAVEKGLVNLN